MSAVVVERARRVFMEFSVRIYPEEDEMIREIQRILELKTSVRISKAEVVRRAIRSYYEMLKRWCETLYLSLKRWVEWF